MHIFQFLISLIYRRILKNDPKSYSCGIVKDQCVWALCVASDGTCSDEWISLLDGTYCGENKICYQFECVNKNVSSNSDKLKKSSELLQLQCPQGASLEKQFSNRNLLINGVESLKSGCEHFISNSGYNACNGALDNVLDISDVVCCEECIMFRKNLNHNVCGMNPNPCFNDGECVTSQTAGTAFRCECKKGYNGKILNKT